LTMYGSTKCIINKLGLITSFSKTFEITLFHRLNQHLQVHNILATEQYEFRKGLSMDNETYKLTDCILKARNNKVHAGGIFL
jgi:hypothetical protein